MGRRSIDMEPKCPQKCSKFKFRCILCWIGQEIAGKLTLRHLYEIAKIKSQDPPLTLLSLQQIVQMLVGIARTCGIKIVRELDPDEYAVFLKEREVIVAEQKEALQAAKEAKMLRTG